MIYYDFFVLAVKSLTHRRLRSMLTIIGIFIGIAAVVALISLGDGLQNAVAGEFQKLGTDKVTIMASAGGVVSGPMASSMSASPLTTSDVETVKRTQGVKLAGAMLMKGATIKFHDKVKPTYILGIPMDESRKMFEDMQIGELFEGRKLKESDGRSLLVGSHVADGMFDRKVAVGDSLELLGQRFQVVGILKTMGNRMDDSSVIMPLSASRDLMSEPKLVSMIIAQTEERADVKEVRDRIEKRLRDKRHEREGEELFSAQTSEQLAASFSTIFSIIQAIVVGIAAISLLVGGIGIMNTMYTAVVERTNEIGVMKAVGAKNSHVLAIFLIEAGLLGLVGGAVGVAIGAGLSKTAEIIVSNSLGTNLLKADLSFELITGALLFSFVVGAVSGVFPARQASKLKPVDALRFE